MSAFEGSQWAELEQLRELEAKIDEDRQQLVHLRATLEQERSGWGNSGAARRRARNVYRRINDDKGGSQPLVFTRTSQNITAAAILLWMMLVPSTMEGRQIRNELLEFLKCAAE
jgi:hypothetical protein